MKRGVGGEKRRRKKSRKEGEGRKTGRKREGKISKGGKTRQGEKPAGRREKEAWQEKAGEGREAQPSPPPKPRRYLGGREAVPARPARGGGRFRWSGAGVAASLPPSCLLSLPSFFSSPSLDALRPAAGSGGSRWPRRCRVVAAAGGVGAEWRTRGWESWCRCWVAFFRR